MHRMYRAVPLLLLATASIAEGAPLRKPTGKWIVDYAETSCSARRNYGSPQSPLILAFRPSPTGAIVRLALARAGPVRQPRHFAVRTNAVPSGTKLTGLLFGAADKKSEVIWINFDRPAMERIIEAGEIAISSGEVNERFALQGFAAVVKALDTCNADLRAYWNMEGAGGVTLSQIAAPEKNLAAYISDEDYPGQAIAEELGGTTRFVLMVDENGILKDCMTEESSGVASLDAVSCMVLVARSKFKPALDAGKRPVRSVLTSLIRWVP